MADAYRMKADVSLPRAIREVETLAGGEKVYETEGRNYAAGAVVLARDISPTVVEKIENGELDHLLEEVSMEDAETVLGKTSVPTYAPEHEAERVVLEEAGNNVLSKEEIVQLNAETVVEEEEAPKPRQRPASKSDSDKSDKDKD